MLETSDPKYRVAERAILQQIERGTYARGERIPPERNLAEQLGMSYMTLRHGVNRLVERGVLERRPGVGTFVCARQAGRNLALLFFNMASIVPNTLAWREVSSVRCAAEAEGRQLRAMLLIPPFQEPEQLVCELRAMDVGAVGLVSFGLGDRPYIDALRHEIPCVLFNKTLPGVPLPCAKPDLLQGARDVVDYFVSHGRRRIGVMASDTAHSQQRELLVAMESELCARGLPIDKAYWLEGDGAPSRDAADDWIVRMLDSEDRPDALLVIERDWPLLLSARMAERGLRIGKDLDLVEQCSVSEDKRRGAPWALLSLEYGNILQNAQQLLLEAARRGTVERSAPVLVSKTVLVPAGE